ncbi:carbohydrate ABC transporter permease [Kribbella sp. NPDC005582]|uniref:carbohydrate ABC transporter permease n=1 Tax=Kribbella sp. NPDC005582 TaxID=3156893 RepID=UPI0033AB8AAD
MATPVLLTAVLFAFGIYFLSPVLWLLFASTKTTAELFNTFGLWFGHHFSLGSQLNALFAEDGHIYLRWLGNTVVYSLLGAGAATVLAAACGYALAKYQFRGRELTFSVVLGGVLVPGTALAIPLYLIMSKIGLTDTYWAVLLPSVVSPFGVYLSRVYATAAVPDELIQAARIDGAGEFRTFATIGMPLMSPALVTVFLFQFVAIWNNFLLPLVMLSDERLYPVTLGLFTWNSQVTHYPQYFGLTVIGSVVSVLPLAVAFMMLQRFWRADLAAGSVK